MTAIQVRLIGGPRDGNVIDHDRSEVPGVTIVMPRIPEDGPMVEDTYRWAPEVAADGTSMAVFTGTRGILKPDPELLKRGPDEAGELDPGLVPYLDWPLGFTYGVHCDKQDCAAGSCDASGSGMVARRDYGTVRELLADIKAHAEAASEGQTDAPAAER